MRLFIKSHVKPIRQKGAAFTVIEVLVVIVILGILVTLVIPAIRSVLAQGQMTYTLSNACKLQQATQAMTLDTDSTSSGGSGNEWTSIVSKGKVTGTATVSSFLAALIEGKYLTRDELPKLLTAPGKGPGENSPTAANICFRFFQVEEKSPSDQPLIVTSNWSDGQLTDDQPYGKLGFVVAYKGGSGAVYRRVSDASSPLIFPRGKSDGPVPYTSNTLK